MPYVLAVLAILGFTVVAVVVTGEGRAGATSVDRALLVASGLLTAYLLHRLASVRIEADDEGLLVVNVLRRRQVEWAEVLAVRLSAGDPWLFLDLADGTSLAAMGIQNADGERAQGDARALASVVAAKSVPDG